MSFHPEILLHHDPLTLVSASSLACGLCGRPVKIETAVTDECGRAVHPSCYLAALKRSEAV